MQPGHLLPFNAAGQGLGLNQLPLGQCACRQKHITRSDDAIRIQVIFLLGSHPGHREHALFRDMMQLMAICFCGALIR